MLSGNPLVPCLITCTFGAGSGGGQARTALPPLHHLPPLPPLLPLLLLLPLLALLATSACAGMPAVVIVVVPQLDWVCRAPISASRHPRSSCLLLLLVLVLVAVAVLLLIIIIILVSHRLCILLLTILHRRPLVALVALVALPFQIRRG